MRISHWIKNLFVFVPLLYSRNLFDAGLLLISIKAVIGFSLVSSVVYIFNDISDADSDRQHPEKKNRPIAKGTVKKAEALSIIIIFIIAGILITYDLNWEYQCILVSYFIINLLYSFKLKNIPIIDILCIASGFILRIIGGAFVINVIISNWLVLTTLFISLFLAIMKRRSEMMLVSQYNKTRIVLEEYSESYLNLLLTISSTAVIVCYALYTVSERTVTFFGTENMVYTIIFVIYGIFRFMYLVLIKQRSENIAEMIMKDLPLIVNIVLYVIFTVVIIYLI